MIWIICLFIFLHKTLGIFKCGHHVLISYASIDAVLAVVTVWANIQIVVPYNFSICENIDGLFVHRIQYVSLA